MDIQSIVDNYVPEERAIVWLALAEAPKNYTRTQLENVAHNAVKKERRKDACLGMTGVPAGSPPTRA